MSEKNKRKQLREPLFTRVILPKTGIWLLLTHEEAERINRRFSGRGPQIVRGGMH